VEQIRDAPRQAIAVGVLVTLSVILTAAVLFPTAPPS
jgi:hypothetical protein